MLVSSGRKYKTLSFSSLSPSSSVSLNENKMVGKIQRFSYFELNPAPQAAVKVRQSCKSRIIRLIRRLSIPQRWFFFVFTYSYIAFVFTSTLLQFHCRAIRYYDTTIMLQCVVMDAFQHFCVKIHR